MIDAGPKLARPRTQPTINSTWSSVNKRGDGLERRERLGKERPPHGQTFVLPRVVLARRYETLAIQELASSARAFDAGLLPRYQLVVLIFLGRRKSVDSFGPLSSCSRRVRVRATLAARRPVR